MVDQSPRPSLARSALYVPLANQRAREKAASLGADVVIYDLEDSITGDAKQAARDALATVPKPADNFVAVRINAADSADHVDDVMAAVAAGMHAILLPKVRNPGEIETLRRVMSLSDRRQAIAVWAMIETPQAVLALPDIAKTVGRDGALVLGLNDLAKETGMAQLKGRMPMLSILTQSVIAARAAGCLVLDAVFNALGDADGFAEETHQALAFGFDGKTVIHPSQIAVANQIFAPSAEAVADAEAIIAAFALPENAGKGVITMNGRMVELLHRDMAETLLAKAQLIAARQKTI